ncbi:hypothetical protein BDR26DRAFT_866411 [Obelidium mucronatum]|nr:hypothetical protein BDR26DRAFT_866411 [Obelidium mucronatum]
MTVSEASEADKGDSLGSDPRDSTSRTRVDDNFSSLFGSAFLAIGSEASSATVVAGKGDSLGKDPRDSSSRTGGMGNISSLFGFAVWIAGSDASAEGKSVSIGSDPRDSSSRTRVTGNFTSLFGSVALISEPSSETEEFGNGDSLGSASSRTRVIAAVCLFGSEASSPTEAASKGNSLGRVVRGSISRLLVLGSFSSIVESRVFIADSERSTVGKAGSFGSDPRDSFSRMPLIGEFSSLLASVGLIVGLSLDGPDESTSEFACTVIGTKLGTLLSFETNSGSGFSVRGASVSTRDADVGPSRLVTGSGSAASWGTDVSEDKSMDEINEEGGGTPIS